MAYNGFYPQYPQQYQMPQQQYQMPQQTPQQMPQQIQNGGFVSVRNEMEARNYPIAPGNSVTFKDETAPYVYTKTMGFSQLDRPIFDKYRLVKEEVTEPTEAHSEAKEEKADNSMLEHLNSEIEAIWQEIDALKKPKAVRKKEEVE